jgi:hemolysin activation/secretion protein
MSKTTNHHATRLHVRAGSLKPEAGSAFTKRPLTLITLALLALSQSAFAQLPTSVGGQMQQIPPPPVQQRMPPEIRFDKGSTPAPPAGNDVKIIVDKLQVTGQTVYSEAELLAVTGFTAGSESSLTQLGAMALKIADFYHKNGYFVAQAYLPPQDIKHRAVTIAVIEGRYGNITVRNQTNLTDAHVNNVLRGLNGGDLIAIAPLEERLLLLSDTPGVIVKSTLVPGAAVGTSDLIVDVTQGKKISGSVEADNAGNPYTGEYRVGANVYINNLTGHGDVASLRVLTSGSGLTYGRVAYQVPFGRATAGVAYSHLDYRLQDYKDRKLSALQAHGTADIASFYGSYALIRSRDANLYALIDYDDRTYQDKVDATSPPSVTDRKVHAWVFGLSGDQRDRFGGGGFSTYLLNLTAGDLDIRTPGTRAFDYDLGIPGATGPRTNGRYDKLGFHVTRLQNLTGPFSLYGSLRGQIASKNLDISEKMELGGMYGVRAYPEGEAYADEGYIATLEGRMRLPKFSQSMPGQMHLIGFADYGHVTVNHTPWLAGQDNNRSLSAAGVGFTWEDYNNFSVRTYWAHRLGNERPTSAPDGPSRFWIQVVKYF